MAADPWLAALLEQYSTTIGRLQRSFVGPEHLQLPSPPTLDEFQRKYQRAEQSPGDGHVARFRQLQDRTRRATELPSPPDRDVVKTFSRYCEWLPFDSRQHEVLDRVRAGLGYGELPPS